MDIAILMCSTKAEVITRECWGLDLVNQGQSGHWGFLPEERLSCCIALILNELLIVCLACRHCLRGHIGICSEIETLRLLIGAVFVILDVNLLFVIDFFF